MSGIVRVNKLEGRKVNRESKLEKINEYIGELEGNRADYASEYTDYLIGTGLEKPDTCGLSDDEALLIRIAIKHIALS